MPFLFLILIALLDVYAANVLQSVQDAAWSKWIWWVSTALVWTGVAFLVFGQEERPNGFYAMDGVGHHGFRAGIHTKTLITLPLLFEDLMRVIQWLAHGPRQ